jgi:hydrogenase maturation protease
MKESRTNSIVIGVGNPFRSDDGVGLAVARRLREAPPTGVTILEETGDGAELLEAWKQAHTVILVDAVHSGAPPGTIHRFDAGEKRLPAWYSHCSTHSFGVAEAIELARTISELPPRLIVYGVEGLDFSPGTEVSLEVAEVVPEVASRILQELGRMAVASPAFPG